MNTPKVSIIMSIYRNPIKEIIASIESIINQTFQDWEFIICLDGSSEGIYKLLKEYERKESRIVVIYNKNNIGLAKSLNRCIKISSGEYIARMDADDISLPIRLEYQLNFLEKNLEYSMVSCNVAYFNAKKVWGVSDLPLKPEKKDFLYNSPFVHPSIMMRRKIYIQLKGYRISKETRRTEDYDLFMRLYSLGYKGYNMRTVLYMYREDINSLKKRKYCYRIDEMKVRFLGFKALGILNGNYRYVIKPLLVGLIPPIIMDYIRKEKYKLKNHEY